MAGLFKSIGNFLFGTPEKRENVSLLRPEQEGLYNQLIGASQGKPQGGAFGQSYNYYNNLLGDESQDYNDFTAPALRQYYQDIVPNISEQFAGMGSGGLSSSGFRNAQNQGAVDLSERLGAIRANLRQQGAQGLQNLGSMGLNNFSQNMVTKQGSPGFLSSVAPAIGGAIGTAIGGPIGGFIGGGLGLGGSNMSGNSVGSNSSPYGSGGPQASPRFSSQLPSFGGF